MINRHVLKNMPPVAGWLAAAYHLTLKADGWLVGNVKGSYNSFYLYKPGDSREFHIRWIKRDKNALTIYPMYFHGNKNGVRIETEDDLMRLVLQITSPSRKKRLQQMSRVNPISTVPKKVA